ncbi:AAA family ATPase [candidate division KSB1 bacterium]|nr:AAA family ATPase [candidate division KSB1 bacterium]
MWIEEFNIDNIKCFETLKLKFGSKGEPYRWITLIGENGTGKSTILQAIGLLVAGPEGAIKLSPRPEGWLRTENKPGKITVLLHQSENDPGYYRGEKKERKVFRYTFLVTGSQKLEIKKRAFTEPVIIADPNSKVIPWLREHALLPKGKGWFGAGYGAFRRLTRSTSGIFGPSMQQSLRYTNFSTQFYEDEPLEAYEQWMLYLEFKVGKNDELAKKQRDLGIEAINKLLPKNNYFDSIDSNGRIWFRIGNVKVPTIALSDGYRSILALAGDLVWRLIEAFPESSNPLEEEGVVLIDELDIHLHPTWQREIPGWLQSTFPRLQLIMATHSPIIAAGAGKDAVTYRFYFKDGNIQVDQVNDIFAWNVDRILKSKAFDLVSEYSQETQKYIDRYYILKRKKKKGLTAEEQLELKLTIPIIEKSLGYNTEISDTEQRLNQYLKEHWQ